MRSFLLFPVTIACAIVALVTIYGNDLSAPESLQHGDVRWATEAIEPTISDARESAGSNDFVSDKLIQNIEVYEDLDYGFSVAVPVGWSRIVSADSSQDNNSQQSSRSVANPDLANEAGIKEGVNPLEPGYAVGFESVKQGTNDQFADYILIEILPGDASGLFTTDGRLRKSVTINNQQTWYERLEVDQATNGLAGVDLVIYQAELAELGYTIGLYAIGEKKSERLMSAAFKIMLQTFKVNWTPFTII